MNWSENFDVIVVGGGHAGTEAALAAARGISHAASHHSLVPWGRCHAIRPLAVSERPSGQGDRRVDGLVAVRPMRQAFNFGC